MSTEEQEGVETIALQYPEVKAAVYALQQDNERFVKLYALTPPPEIKDRLLDIIRQEDTQAGHARLPAELRQPAPEAVRPAPVKKLPVAPKSKDVIWKYLTAAIVALLIGSVIMNFFFFNKSTDYKSRYKSLIAAKEKLDEEKEHQTLTRATTPDLELLNDTAVKWVKMTGSGHFAGTAVTVCWNPQTQIVYLLVLLMPVPPPGKQFQLWAIANEKMINAGVFDSGAEVSQKMQQMKTIALADAFAVTLEKKGGSTAPSMDQLYMKALVKK
nr:anti-sigma factor [Chitinophaga nivalis]